MRRHTDLPDQTLNIWINLEYMQMHSMLAQALNQQEMVNWKAVPTLKIKRENFFFLSGSISVYK